MSYTQSRVPGGLLHQPPSHPSFRPTHDVKTTEDPHQYSTNDDSPGTPHVSDTSDVFVGTPASTFKVPMEEYFTDNLLPVVEGEDSTTSSSSSSSQSLSSTGRGLQCSKCLEALHQLHYIKKFGQVYPDSLEIYAILSPS